MHDLVSEADRCHHVQFFNPGRATNKRSRLRLINPGESAAEITIHGAGER